MFLQIYKLLILICLIQPNVEFWPQKSSLSRNTKVSVLLYESLNSYRSFRNSCYEVSSSSTHGQHWIDPTPACKHTTQAGYFHSYLRQIKEHVESQTSLVTDVIAICRHVSSNITSALLRKGAVTELKQGDICSLAISIFIFFTISF